MIRRNALRNMSLIAMAFVLTACASMETLVSAPGVSLRNVTVTDLGFSGQTFVLGFDVVNPNPFPLPISEVSYGIELDGHGFASGETAAKFSIPAEGDGEFAINVRLNLLKTAPQLLYVIRDGVRGDIPYELAGELVIDLPLVKPVSFRSTGEIHLQASNSRVAR